MKDADDNKRDPADKISAYDECYSFVQRSVTPAYLPVAL